VIFLVIALKRLNQLGLQAGGWCGGLFFFSFFFFLEELFADEGWIESLLYCTSIILNENAALTDGC